MENIRVVLAILSFLTGCYLIFDLFYSGFNFYVLLCGMLAFVITHYLLPKNLEKSDDDGDTDLSILVQIIIDLPFRCISYFLRSLGRLSRSGEGVDNDVDL